jgi:hypothetical protein
VPKYDKMEDSLSFDLSTQDVQKLFREAEDSLNFELRACQNTDKMEDSLSFENPRMARNCLARNPMVGNLAFCTNCPSLMATFHLEVENHS